MIRKLCVLFCGAAVASCGMGDMPDARADHCICTEPGLPTAEEVHAKAEALGTRDIARIEQTKAQERKAQLVVSASTPSAARVGTLAMTSSAVVSSPYRVIVSFDAAGASSQSATARKFDELVAELEQQSGRGIARRFLAGSDGGFSVCLPLAELNGDQQRVFVSELRSQLVPLGSVLLDEHVPCGWQLGPAR